MKSEMDMINLLRNCQDSLKASPGPKAKSTVDVYTNKNDSTSAQGGVTQPKANNTVDPKPAFRKILNEVASANKKAVAATEGRSSMRSQKTKQSQRKDQTDEQPLMGESFLNTNASDATDKTALPEAQSFSTADESETATSPSDASAILRKAIEKISQTLNLKIGQGLEAIQIENSTPEIKELCAEMLSALKGIMGILENAASTDQTVTISGKQFDASQAASIGQTLRTEVFHIEMALSMAGSSGDVAALVAQKSNQQADTGLIQAKDPGTMVMSASDIKQMLDKDLFTDGQKIETVFSKLAQMLREQAASGASGNVKIASDGQKNVMEAAVTGVSTDSGGKKVPDVGEFDSQVMRTLLKIDKTENGNKEAALQNGELDLPKIVSTLFAKKPGDITEAQSEKLDAVLQGIFTGKNQTGASELVDQLKSAAPSKTLEESVMKELSGKVQAAVKTGVTEIRLLLRPESLGEMRVKLTLDGDVVMAKIYVENQQVKHIIETNMQSLKDSLAQHNLQTGSFDVSVGSDAREQLNNLPRHVIADAGNDDGELPDALENAEASADKSFGSETGRRFGSNTIEYFA